ncbi:MAG: hypothetical protein JSU08_03360 [Acidobacteria bacterium]|nr:hypothetical protein [Acidobacteriota bacterium]
MPLDQIFVNHAADVLADTNNGLTGAQIIKVTSGYALEHDVRVPHPTVPFEAPNKRTALADNLMAFSEPLRYQIIKNLCEHGQMPAANTHAVQKLKVLLMSRYRHLAAESLGSSVNEDLVEQTKHWLDPFPDSLKLYNEALTKYANKVFLRNLIDDLRLALEKLVQALVGNGRTLENNVDAVGAFMKAKGGSPELRGMFREVLSYYCKYQNTYVKHDDAVIEEEVDILLEMTSSLMKHLVRLA